MKKLFGDNEEIIIQDSLEGLGTIYGEGMVVHALCLGGNCRLVFNGKNYDLTKGRLFITPLCNLITQIKPSDDFKIEAIFIKNRFINLSIPRSGYSTIGRITLYKNPIMQLTEEQQQIFKKDIETIKERIENSGHNFHEEIVANAVQMMILDFYDFHSSLYNRQFDFGGLGSNIFNRFIELLENKEFRFSREVAYFADKLFITPKYLSEVTKDISGNSANYWINTYTIRDITHFLKDRSISLDKIVEIFNFSSKAYFSRYVHRHLGLTPNEYRN